MIASSGFATFFVTELGHGIHSLKNLRVKVYFFMKTCFWVRYTTNGTEEPRNFVGAPFRLPETVPCVTRGFQGEG